MNRVTGEAIFRGKARLWQGTNSVTAPIIELSHARATLHAHGEGSAPQVNAALAMASDPKHPQTVIRIQGRDLFYSDAQREARFRGNVVAQDPSGTIHSDQADVLGAVKVAVATTGLPAVAYPNRGGSWDAVTKTWEYGDPIDLGLVPGWLAAGVRYVGGCCGTGPDDIAALAGPVLSHRVLPSTDAQLARHSVSDIIDSMVRSVPVPDK